MAQCSGGSDAPGLDNVVVVLVETSHPGNIGASARAMKAMGLRRLRLVNPQRYPSAEATERAAGADDVLHEALLYPTLEAALADTVWAVATSARARHLDWPALEPAASAREALARSRSGPVAIVFGRERTGLSNAELDHCQALVTISTDPGFRSLNLASAVQILAYEARRAWLGEEGGARAPEPRRRPLASPAELEGLYAHLEQALAEVGYFDPAKPKLLPRRLRRLFGRAALERSELNILRGALTAVQKALLTRQE